MDPKCLKVGTLPAPGGLSGASGPRCEGNTSGPSGETLLCCNAVVAHGPTKNDTRGACSSAPHPESSTGSVDTPRCDVQLPRNASVGPDVADKVLHNGSPVTQRGDGQVPVSCNGPVQGSIPGGQEASHHKGIHHGHSMPALARGKAVLLLHPRLWPELKKKWAPGDGKKAKSAKLSSSTGDLGSLTPISPEDAGKSRPKYLRWCSSAGAKPSEPEKPTLRNQKTGVSAPRKWRRLPNSGSRRNIPRSRLGCAEGYSCEASPAPRSEVGAVHGLGRGDLTPFLPLSLCPSPSSQCTASVTWDATSVCTVSRRSEITSSSSYVAWEDCGNLPGTSPLFSSLKLSSETGLQGEDRQLAMAAEGPVSMPVPASRSARFPGSPVPLDSITGGSPRQGEEEAGCRVRKGSRHEQLLEVKQKGAVLGRGGPLSPSVPQSGPHRWRATAGDSTVASPGRGQKGSPLEAQEQQQEEEEEEGRTDFWQNSQPDSPLELQQANGNEKYRKWLHKLFQLLPTDVLSRRSVAIPSVPSSAQAPCSLPARAMSFPDLSPAGVDEPRVHASDAAVSGAARLHMDGSNAFQQHLNGAGTSSVGSGTTTSNTALPDTVGSNDSALGDAGEGLGSAGTCVTGMGGAGLETFSRGGTGWGLARSGGRRQQQRQQCPLQLLLVEKGVMRELLGDFLLDITKLEVGEVLAQGSSGEVRRGWYRNQDVAVKILKPANEGTVEEGQRHALAHRGAYRGRNPRAALAVPRAEFRREVLALLSTHQHGHCEQLLPLVGFCVDRQQRLCIVTEFMPRGTLYDVLATSRKQTLPPSLPSLRQGREEERGQGQGQGDGQEQGLGPFAFAPPLAPAAGTTDSEGQGDLLSLALPLPELLHIASDVARGMAFLHKHGIMHRDLKSANVFLSSHGAVVGDLGVACLRGEGGEVTKEVGTYRWMAPEAFGTSAWPVTFKSDVYSFGILLWEMVTGEVPYEGYTPMQAAVAVALSGLRPQIPEFCPQALAGLIGECWDKDPPRRPSFADIVVRLEQLKGTGC